MFSWSAPAPSLDRHCGILCTGKHLCIFEKLHILDVCIFSLSTWSKHCCIFVDRFHMLSVSIVSLSTQACNVEMTRRIFIITFQSYLMDAWMPFYLLRQRVWLLFENRWYWGHRFLNSYDHEILLRWVNLCLQAESWRICWGDNITQKIMCHEFQYQTKVL